MSKPTPAGLANLGDFKPATPAPDEVPAVSRAAAAAHGFVERDAPKPIKRRRASEEPTVSFTMRIDVSDQNDFIEWCDRERLPYREGFKRIMAAVRKGAI
ncbi:hypothetical protein [Methylobacterium sp. Gmos1]